MEFNLVFKRGMEVLELFEKKVPKLKPQTGTPNKVGIASCHTRLVLSSI
jgi:hypothetical protein